MTLSVSNCLMGETVFGSMNMCDQLCLKSHPVYFLSCTRRIHRLSPGSTEIYMVIFVAYTCTLHATVIATVRPCRSEGQHVTDHRVGCQLLIWKH